MDSYEAAAGPIAEMLRGLGIRSSVGAPIVVYGQLWGVAIASSKGEAPLPPDAEARIGAFTELVAAALSNTEARAETRALADEQAALRRVATLVAREASPTEVLETVAQEVAQVLGTEGVGLVRFEADGVATVLAQSDTPWEPVPLGTRFPLDGENVVTAVHRTGEAARLDDWSDATGAAAAMAHTLDLRSAVGTPIVVEGRLWGTMVAVTRQVDPLPADTERRIEEFTELVATAISNAEAQRQLSTLAEEQAALRRVATLVAEGAPPSAVLDAVVAEMKALLDADQVALNRFEPGDEIIVLAHRGLNLARTPVGSRVSTQGESATAAVRRTGQPARIEDYEGASSALAEAARATGVRSSVSAPITVEGRLWGLITASWKAEESPPPDTEERMEKFARLLDTAIANSEARADVAASRARIVAAADEERRRVVRDLHDGAQQRLVHTVITLKLARRALKRGDQVAPVLAEALDQAQRATEELRELVHGILPDVLVRGGLRAGVDALASRTPMPVQTDVPGGRLPAAVEATAYFVVAEALTNIVKHAGAKHATVKARVDGGTLALRVQDDGVGGARPEGSGLLGLADRVAALGGEVRVESPAGSGTLVAASIPLTPARPA
jgi:signal transduction histidine kinase